MREDFDSLLLPLLKRYPRRLTPGAWTFSAFCRAASWVASRAFFVNEWHGQALVPLADAFNHKVWACSPPASWVHQGDRG
jgi:SET domain-containing protein 6